MSSEYKSFGERYVEMMQASRAKDADRESMPLVGKIYLAACGLLVLAASLELLALIILFAKL